MQNCILFGVRPILIHMFKFHRGVCGVQIQLAKYLTCECNFSVFNCNSISFGFIFWP
uniref:Uncharacterized protein n=1 Tax=Arundo donax TaxID=35708 RepID=A0A0A9ARH5_ARUDO